MKRKTKLPSDWRDRLVLIKDLELSKYECTVYKLCFIKGRTPKGFPNVIGEFILEDNCIHCHIGEYFQNRGLGILCYQTILHKHGDLNTNYHSASDQAKAIWRKLVKLYDYETEFWTGRLTVTLRPEQYHFPAGIPIQ